MKLQYLKRARDDLDWFRRYYSRVFPEGKQNTKTQLRRTLQLISDHSSLGTVPDDFSKAYEYPIPRTPFSIIYRVVGDTVQILRVFDQRTEFSNDRKLNTEKDR